MAQLHFVVLYIYHQKVLLSAVLIAWPAQTMDLSHYTEVMLHTGLTNDREKALTDG